MIWFVDEWVDLYLLSGVQKDLECNELKIFLNTVGIPIVHWSGLVFTYSIEFIGGYVVAFLGVEKVSSQGCGDEVKGIIAAYYSHRY